MEVAVESKGALRPFRLFAFLALAPAAARSADGEEKTSIGTQGATIRLDASWKKTKLNPDFSGDQFQLQERSLFKRTQVFLMVREIEALLENPLDLERVLKEQTKDMQSTARLKPGAVEMTGSKEIARASQELDAEYRGVKLRYRLEVLSSSGLSYLLIGSGASSDAAEVTRAIKAAADTLSFPGRETAWGKLADPVTRRLVHGDLELAFSVRPAVFPPGQKPEGRELVHLKSRDGSSAIFVYDETAEDGVDAFLDGDLNERRQKESTARETSRRDVQIAGLQGRESVIEDDELTVWIAALPHESGRCLELRYASTGPAGLRRADRDLFFESFRIARAGDLEGLPSPEHPAAPSAPVDEHLARLLEAARLLGDTRLGEVRHAQVDGGRLLVSDARTIRELSFQDGSSRVLYRAGESPSLTFAPWSEDLALEDGSGKLSILEDGEVDSMDVRASRVAWGGPERLLVLRKLDLPLVPGLGSLAWCPPDRLIAIEGEDDSERVVLEASEPIRHVQANGAATAALVVTGPREAPGKDPGALLIVTLDSGETKTLGGWRSVSSLGPAGDGWVVTGRPFGRPGGVYLVSRDGALDLLISGPEARGVAARDGSLIFLNTTRPPQSSAGACDTLLAYEVSLDVTRKHGPLSLPFSAALLSGIGHEVLHDARDGWPFRTGEEVLECARRAREMARLRVGREFPTHDESFDRLTEEVFYGRAELSAHGEVLLGILLAAGFLERGAAWVPSEKLPGTGLWQPRIVQTVDNPLAVAYSPADVIASTLHDDEGMWRPARAISRYLKGRRLLLGLDRTTLQEAVDGTAVPDFALSVRRGDGAEIAEALRAAPGNEHLRERAYLHLASAGRHDLLSSIAAELAKRDGAPLLDRKAWFLARLETAKSAEELRALSRDIEEAIRRDPGEPSFCFYLGRAEESAGGDPKRARAAYRRVLKLQDRGELADRARERLDSMEQ
ncbi:MAG: hypothetical protein HY721_17330 [Planctomycetes bacterium]|nr:hypothetical protein [Planctomycetota bacterium]